VKDDCFEILLSLDKGKVEMNGTDAHSIPSPRTAHRVLLPGICPVPYMNMLENMAFGLRIKKKKTWKRKK